VNGEGAHADGTGASLLFPGIINWKRWWNNKNIQQKNTQLVKPNIRI
jgi:hypothetical protein